MHCFIPITWHCCVHIPSTKSATSMRTWFSISLKLSSSSRRIWKSRSSDDSAINLLFWASIFLTIVVIIHWWFSWARERISRLSSIDTHRPSLLRYLDCVSLRCFRLYEPYSLSEVIFAKSNAKLVQYFLCMERGSYRQLL
jgi:hypothetical protein